MEIERVNIGGKIAVVAVGGNSLLKSKELKTVEDQYRAICKTMASVVELAEQHPDWVLMEDAGRVLLGGGKRVVITDPAHVARAVAGGTGTHIIP